MKTRRQYGLTIRLIRIIQTRKLLTWDYVPLGIQEHAFYRVDPQMLSLLRRHLKPEQKYFLRFSNPEYPVSCSFGDLLRCEPSKPKSHQKVQIPCSRRLLELNTVAGTPLPRFTVATALSSSLCSLPESPVFHLSLPVMSLKKQPVYQPRQSDGVVSQRYIIQMEEGRFRATNRYH